MPDLTVWPTDGADGSVSSEARWRKMARLWIPSGVDASPLTIGPMTPTLVAGPAISVAIGAVWVDGHYAELTTAATVPVTANGLLVVRFTPADNHAELLYRDTATTPTQTVTTWELPIAAMVAGVMKDRRTFADPQSAGVGYVEKVATGNLICTATYSVVPGSAALLGVGRWMVQGCVEVQASAADASAYFQSYIGAYQAVAPDIVTVSQFACITRGLNQGFGRYALPQASTFDVRTPSLIGVFGSVTVVTGGVTWTITGSTRWTAIRVGPAQ